MEIVSLTTLRPGQRARIHAVHAEDGFRQRLTALGFRSGRVVELVRSAAFRGPVQLRVGSAAVVLRRAEANRIEVILDERDPIAR
ncbi:FeoA family protein [Endothiovibrio diazotrophicus]